MINTQQALVGICIFCTFNSMNMIKKIFFIITSFTVVTGNAQNADFEWAKSIGGNRGQAIAFDRNNNSYTLGQYSDTVDFNPGSGTYTLGASYQTQDLFISKFDKSGNFLSVMDITDYGSPIGNSISIDASGNMYIAGYFSDNVDFDPGPATYFLNSGSSTLYSSFVLKLDSIGNFMWAKKFDNVSGWSRLFSMTTDRLKNVCLTGNFRGTVDFDPGSSAFNLTSVSSGTTLSVVAAAFIAKLDSMGRFVWAKKLDGTGDCGGASIAVDISGNVYTAGYFSNNTDFDPGSGVSNIASSGSLDIFISKLNSSGDFVFAKTIGGVSNDVGRSLSVDRSGNIYTTGFYLETADFDPGAGVFNLSSPGTSSIFVSKLNASGNFVWARSFSGSDQKEGYSIAVDTLKNVYSSGFFMGTSDFDPGAGTFHLTSLGATDVFISKLDSSGNFLWAGSVGSINPDYGFYSVRVDRENKAYLTGSVNGPADLDPGPGIYQAAKTGSFLLKLGQNPTAISSISKSQALKVYPNPNAGFFKVQLDGEIIKGEIRLFNSIGQKIYEQKVTQGTNDIHISGLASGLYIYSLLSDNQKIEDGKFIVE